MPPESVVAGLSDVLPAVNTASRSATLSCQAVGATVLASEVLIVTASSIAAAELYQDVFGLPGGSWPLSTAIGLSTAILRAAAAQSAGLYRLPALLHPVEALGRHLAVCGTVLLFATGVFFCFKVGASVSRGMLCAFALLMTAGCVLLRLSAPQLIAALVARGRVVGQPVLLVGEKQELAALESDALLTHYGLRDVARLGWVEVPTRQGHTLERVIEHVPRLARETGAKGILVVAGWHDSGQVEHLAQALRASPLPVRLAPNRVLRAVIDRAPWSEDRLRHLVVLQREPMRAWNRASKRALDLCVASIALLALSPVMLVAAIAVKLDSPGPVLFRQRRSGFDQRHFTILKFRTMRVGDEASVVQAQRGDERVTAVGAFLRRSSIDELPQFLNVLRGDMSLVGPRPHALAHDNAYRALIGDYTLRHHVKPGITGWAQVNGHRGETANIGQMAARIAMDLRYIERWSMLLDLEILGRTVVEVLKLDAY